MHKSDQNCYKSYTVWLDLFLIFKLLKMSSVSFKFLKIVTLISFVPVPFQELDFHRHMS